MERLNKIEMEKTDNLIQTQSGHYFVYLEQTKSSHLLPPSCLPYWNGNKEPDNSVASQKVKFFMRTLLICILLVFKLSSCISPDIKPLENDWDVVAHWSLIEGDSVMVADVNKAEVETTLPLEMIADDYQVIKLDKEAEEFRELSDAFITENYIGISSYNNEPFRLFKKDGTFFRPIGALGEEENGNYETVSNAQIDEANNRIYIMPANHKKTPTTKSPVLLAYDLAGNFLHEIPLACRIGFGSSFKVDAPKGEIIVIGQEVRPERKEYRTWVQDMEGNLKYGIYDEDKKNDDGYGIMTMSFYHTDAVETFAVVSPSMYSDREETEFLYHLNQEERRLVPKFQAVTKEKSNFIYELPSYYIVESTMHAGDADAKTPQCIIDKKTLKGARFNGFVTPEGLLLDQYTLLSKTRNGYFSLVEKESRILKRIQKTDKSKLTKEQRKKLEQLYEKLNSDKNDDTILFMAKFKK